MTKNEILTTVKEKGTQDALVLREKTVNGEVTDTEVIAQEDCVPAFDPKKDYSGYPVGTPVKDEGQVWSLTQPHNASYYTGRPATLRALWGIKHTKDPAKAKPYVAPYGTSGLYMTDECCEVDGVIYKSKVDNNAYSPGEYMDNWEVAT